MARDARAFRSATMGVILLVVTAAFLTMPLPTLAGGGDILDHGSLLGLTTERDALFDVAAGPDGTLYVTGVLDQGIAGGWIVVAKYDAETNLSWRRSYRPPGMMGASGSRLAVDTDQADNVAALACDTKGGVYLAADTWPTATTQKATLINYTTAGRRAWQRDCKGVMGDGGANLSDLAVVSAGAAWITGYVSRPAAVTQWYAARYDPTGRRRWLTRWDGFSNDPQGGRAWACELCGDRGPAVVGELGTSGLGRVGGVLWLRR